MNLTYPNYVWIFYDYFPKDWWMQESENDSSCTDIEIKEFLKGALSLRRNPLALDVTSITDAGIVSVHALFILP